MKELFSDWLSRHFPERKEKVLNRVRDMRGGPLYDGSFAARGKGVGPWAHQLGSLFRVHRDRYHLTRPPDLSTEAFRLPLPDTGPQMELF